MDSKATLTIIIALLLTFPVTAQEPAILFSGTDLSSGKLIRLEDYRGKIVFIDFWASWCPPCLASLPAYEQMRSEIGTENFEIIAINVDEDTNNALGFLVDTPVSYPVIADPEGEIGIPYGIRSLPVSFVVDEQGIIVRKLSSYQPGDEIELKNFIVSLFSLSP
jgi:thiol-disulfide isomerase/thioredoxin